MAWVFYRFFGFCKIQGPFQGCRNGYPIFDMYASPVIYPISEIPEKYKLYLAWNPLTFIVESYRELLLGHSTGCSTEFAIPSIVVSLIIFTLGLALYNSTQRTYVDMI